MALPSLLIVGSGSQARYVIDIVKEKKNFKIIGIADIENAAHIGKKINGISVLCLASDIPSKYSAKKIKLILAYGNNQKKKELVQLFEKNKFSFASAISSKATVSSFSEIGAGCIINPGAVVMPNAQIGNHVIIHSGCVVEHDNLIGDFANLAPGVIMAGRVSVGAGATLYTGAHVIPDVKIGAGAVVAAGSLVTKNVPDNARVAGFPARAIQNTIS